MESNDFCSPYTMEDFKKRVRNALIISLSLIAFGFVLGIILAFSFAGEDGYIRDDAPGELIYFSLVPIILGVILLFVPLISAIKLAKFTKQYGAPFEITPEQLAQDFDEMKSPLKKAKIIVIIVVVLFIGILFILSILGELSWSEFFKIIF